jgi:hypothetical protein
MSFWNKIQEDLKKNIHEGLEIFKEGSSAVTEKIEKLTEGGKNKYKAFNLNMKVQEDFAKLGGEIYDLITKKSKNPLASKKVKSIITRINKFEAQINKLESKGKKKPRKTTSKKTARKTTKKTTGKTAAKRRVKTKSARKAPVSTKES